MDSGNSGSLQSSSGGDEEYDSRAASISAFMNDPTARVGSISQPTQPPPLPQNPTHTAMFDSLSNYLQLQNPSPLFNPNMIWSKTLRSEPNSTDIINPILSSSPFMDSFSTVQSPTVSAPTVPAPVSGPSDDHNHNLVARNPKKRSRASRRAPTTVLTTDTTNFRAMVQEFTGIPAPPFTSSPFQRSRIDFFNTPTAAVRSSSLDAAQPPYLRRPFPQKMQPPPPPPFHSSASSSLLNPPQSSNLFTTLLQSTMKFPLANSTSMIGSKAQNSLEIPSNDSHIKMGGLDEYAVSPRNDDQAQVSGNYYNFSTNAMNGKMNYLAHSSSNFHGEKGPDSVAATRGEGMVESWICSSSD
ncbi:vq motif-containing protein [Abeliophyllum distichum]|uniref:Vq motif-containing protein n=1 Tax=Abeliophyllum distichum TaxID=126358 RepID=A0ABD1SVV5_9LAMI